MIALLGVLLGAPVAAVHAASFQVSPTRFEFSLSRRFTNFFTVTNNSSTTLRLRVSTGFLEPDAQGRLRPVSGSPYDLAPWLVINPRRINLAPSEKRVVRFTVRAPHNLSEGEYRTVVFFEELPPRPVTRQHEGTGFEIQLLTRLGITIYGVLGHPAPVVVMESPKALALPDGIHFEAVAYNSGKLHGTLNIQLTLLDASGDIHGQAKENLVVQRDQRRPVDMTIGGATAGTYRLHAAVHIGKQSILDAELPVTVGADAH